MGWTGGYVLLALLLCGPICASSGRFTVPEFIGDRSTARRAHRGGDLPSVISDHLRDRPQMTGAGSPSRASFASGELAGSADASGRRLLLWPCSAHEGASRIRSLAHIALN